MHAWRLLQALFLLTSTLLGCRASNATCVPRPLAAKAALAVPLSFPAASWGEVEPAAALGYDPERLAQALLSAQKSSMTGFMALVNGHVLMRAGDEATPNYVASVRKSLLSLLVGQLVSRGTLHLDSTLASLGITDVGGLSDLEQSATVRDLLAARSGVYHPASNRGDAAAEAPPRNSQRPGTYFLYNNWDFNALGTIVSQAAGESIYRAFDDGLARPLGMQDYLVDRQRLEQDVSRSVHGAYHLQLSTRDLARVGLLMLAGGRWQQAQVVDASWVETVTRPVTPSADLNPPAWRREGLAYGYLFWVLEAPEDSPWRGAYSAQGAGGQFLLVAPRLGLVIAHEKAEGAPGRVSWPDFLNLACAIANARSTP